MINKQTNNKLLKIDGKIFTILSNLGQGTYGSVYLIQVNDKGEKNNRAAKLISNDPKKGIRSLHEIDIMNRLVHPNIVHSTGLIAEVSFNTTTELILMPIASTDLYEYVQKDFKVFTITQRLKILYDIVLGINFMHRSNYLHLDLKLENILLFGISTKSSLVLQAKITDFGISLHLQGEKSVYYPIPLFTVNYRPIEALEGRNIYTTSSDIWSLGNIFFKVLSGGKNIFEKYNEIDVKKSIYKYFSPTAINSTLNSAFDNLNPLDKYNAIDITRRMLSFNPSDRPSTYEILTHPLFSRLKNVTNAPILYNSGYLKINTIRQPRLDIIYYYGFDYLVRLSINNNLRLETVFLAGDLYQNSLFYSGKLVGNFAKDSRLVSLLISTCLYMAVKMCEKIIIDPKTLAESFDNIFTEFDIIKTEVFLVQTLKGIIYPSNLFSGSLSLEALKLSFTWLRNIFIYYKLNMNIWIDDNKRNIIEGRNKLYNKHILFKDFLALTNYKHLMNNFKQDEYIEMLYNTDKNG